MPQCLLHLYTDPRPIVLFFFSFFSNVYSLALAVNKSPRFLVFIKRAQRPLKRKWRVCEQATDFVVCRLHWVHDRSTRTERTEGEFAHFD